MVLVEVFWGRVCGVSGEFMLLVVVFKILIGISYFKCFWKSSRKRENALCVYVYKKSIQNQIFEI